MPPSGLFCAPVLLTLCVFSGSPAGVSRYFPATGPGAVHQDQLDLRCPVVVLSVAAEPGMEDLPTLAALRMESGARIVSAYLTDGESTPGDDDGALPYQLAARRRVEADHAVRVLGGDALFLGFPDYGIVSGRARLAELWNRDSVISRLVRIIGSTRPDVILLARDARSSAEGADTVRPALLRELVLDAVAAARRGTVYPGRGGEPWTVSRVFLEDPLLTRGVSALPGAVHPVWKKKYRDFAREASASYGSLHVRIALWNSDRRGYYRLLRHSEMNPSRGLVDGLPPVTPAIQEAARDVAAAAGVSTPAGLRTIAVAISTVERTIRTQRNGLLPHEKRTLLSWKTSLEDLRCAVRGIEITHVASDTLLAHRQFFTVRFPSSKKFPAGGMSEIIFPTAADSTWWINRGTGYVFPFSLPDTLEMITPDNLAPNRPVAVYSHSSFMLNSVLPYIIAHRDKDPVMNFALRGEILFGTSPAQNFEILTPIVRITQGARLIVRLQNISRDIYTGTVSVGDTVVRPTAIKFSLAHKDVLVTETLPLAWKDSVADGDYPIELHIGKGPALATFTARKFRADADTTRPVGLVTGLSSSPVEAALSALHVPCRLLNAGSFGSAADSTMHTVIIDRDALALRRDAAAIQEAVAGWVRAGGHCVILGQSLPFTDGGALGATLGFLRGHPVPPEAGVRADESGSLTRSPNPLAADDWNGWIIARAQCSLRISDGANAVIPVRDAVSGMPLVASVAMGNGRLTAVALDLSPQLQMVHPGGYRLLANLCLVLSIQRGDAHSWTVGSGSQPLSWFASPLCPGVPTRKACLMEGRHSMSICTAMSTSLMQGRTRSVCTTSRGHFSGTSGVRGGSTGNSTGLQASGPGTGSTFLSPIMATTGSSGLTAH